MRLRRVLDRFVSSKPSAPLPTPAEAWGPDLPALAQISAASRRSWIFVHPPKSGGTTLWSAFDASPDWRHHRLVALERFSTPCECGSGCPHGPRDTRIVDPTWARTTESLLVAVGHVPYSVGAWLRDALTDEGGRVDKTVMTIRPTRDRVVSMFRDYWTQVRLARDAENGAELSPHRLLDVRGYANDARHYERRDGSIDGRRWFTSFARYGSGTPFFLSEIFDGPDHAEAEVANGRLTLLQTSNIDSWITGILGSPPVRARVSSPAHPEAVEAALADARDLVDELARRDDDYAWMVNASTAQPGG